MSLGGWKTLFEKSSEVLSTYKADLKEFGEQLAADTTGLVKKEGEENSAPGRGASPTLTQSWEERRENSTSYLDALTPEESDLYREWIPTLHLPDQGDNVKAELEAHPNVARAHTELVPDRITYEQFWSRYFFLKTLQEREESKRRLLDALESPGDDDDDDGWGDDDLEPQSGSQAVAVLPITVDAEHHAEAVARVEVLEAENATLRKEVEAAKEDAAVARKEKQLLMAEMQRLKQQLNSANAKINRLQESTEDI